MVTTDPFVSFNGQLRFDSLSGKIRADTASTVSNEVMSFVHGSVIEWQHHMEEVIQSSLYGGVRRNIYGQRQRYKLP